MDTPFEKWWYSPTVKTFSTTEGAAKLAWDAALRERLAAMQEAFCKSAELHHRFGNKVGHPGEFTNCPNADCCEVRAALAVSGGE